MNELIIETKRLILRRFHEQDLKALYHLLKDEQVNYYNDYIVLNESGAYIMKVYSKDNPQKVLTQAQFFVR